MHTMDARSSLDERAFLLVGSVTKLLSVWIGLNIGVVHAGERANMVAGKVQVSSVVRLVESGRYRQAVQLSRRILERGSASPAVVSLMGIALVRSGLNSDALPWLEQGMGTQMYLEHGGAPAHADALRAVGFGARAWGVRAAAIDPSWPVGRRIRAQCHSIDDLLSAGHVQAAVEVGEGAVLEAPNSATAHAFYSTALLASGSVAEAEFHHWLSQRLSNRRIPRITINEARLAVYYSDDVGALRAWGRASIQRRNDAQIATWHAEWLRSQGELEMAWSAVDRTNLARQQHAALIFERIRVLEALGRPGDAQKERVRAQRLFPTFPHD